MGAIDFEVSYAVKIICQQVFFLLFIYLFIGVLWLCFISLSISYDFFTEHSYVLVAQELILGKVKIMGLILFFFFLGLNLHPHPPTLLQLCYWDSKIPSNISFCLPLQEGRAYYEQTGVGPLPVVMYNGIPYQREQLDSDELETVTMQKILETTSFYQKAVYLVSESHKHLTWYKR